MSDCSTDAMKPKEPPETCSNCGHSCGHETKLYGCVYFYVPCLLNGTFEHASNRCSDWEPCGKCGDLEPACNFMCARMQELEQVAREMLRYLIRYETKAGNPFDSGCHLVSDGYRDHLEALGVSIDD